ncbi:serine/threonine protein kinase [Cystobacter fuscus]|uniref:serine/threonine protein kinase n=1 Tax=Cystobacter fuscus TaxID=43 RepID=UPI002B29C336|nr:protein kinase [Cystobacter fuscus]
MSPPRHPHELRAGDFVRDYRIVRRLGVGGFSFVFLVERGGLQFSLKMAAKPLSAEDPDQVDAWMRREVASMDHMVGHPLVLPVFEWSRWPDARTGYAYFLTTYVPGDTFHVWRWRRRASLHESVGVLSTLARTLEVLHWRGVCHRDLKADNVLVHEADGEPLLIDFGSAHLPGARTLTEGVAPGTLYCQPPEVVSFLFSDARVPGARMRALPSADLYAFGVLLYETLTQCRPFSSRLPLSRLLIAIASSPVPDPRRFDPSIPEPLAALTLSLLEKEPAKRPPNAEAVRLVLERVRAEGGDTGVWRAPSKRPSECEWGRELPEEMELLNAAEEGLPAALEARRPRKGRGRTGARLGRLAALALVLGVLGIGWMCLRVAHPPFWEAGVRTEPTAPVPPVPSEKGTQPVPSSLRPESSADTAPVPLASRWCALLTGLLGASIAQLAGCATVPRQPDPQGYLSQCTPEARATPVKLGIKPDEHPSFLTPTSGTPASDLPIEEAGALNIKPGPVSADMLVEIKGKELYVTIFGVAEMSPNRVHMRFDRLRMPEGAEFPICGVAVDDMHQYGIATWQKFAIPGAGVDPSRVDTTGGGVTLNDPRFETVLQGPEGYEVPPIRLAPPDWR